MRTIILISLSLLLLVPNFIPADINGIPAHDGKERYDAKLGHIRSVAQLEHYVDKCAQAKQIDTQSPEYAAMLAYVISCRFYHGFSHWTLNENWIAAVGQKITGIGLACKVQPDEVLQHPNAACSQQALVMMAVLRNKGISYRKVGFPHHYALEVFVGDQWYYFDPNMEPKMNLAERTHEQWAGFNDNLKKFYDPAVHQNLDFQFGKGQKAVYGPINEIPARNASVFQAFTSFGSKILWLLPLVVLAFSRRPRSKMYAIRPVNRRPVYRMVGHYPYYS